MKVKVRERERRPRGSESKIITRRERESEGK